MWTPNIKIHNPDQQIDFPVACETKIDGEFVHWDGRQLFNKRYVPKKTITKLPVNIAFYGELYFGDGKEFYSEIHSHADDNNMVILFDTDDYGKKPYHQRRIALEVFEDVKIVPMEIANNELELMACFKRITDEGFEGIVVKPLDSLTDKTWVKMKREFTCNLLIRGLRKDKKIPTITVGTLGHIYGSVSLNGWDIVTRLMDKERKERGEGWVIGEDKEQFFLNSDIVLEIKHNGIIMPSNKLRNPRVKRIRETGSEVSIL